jgi:WD40 repeat protein
MSLAQALALVSTRKTTQGQTKRKFDHSKQDELLGEAMAQIDEVAVVEYPNITIYGGDYSGNILGCRICPPLTTKSSNNDDNDLSDDDFDASVTAKQNKSRVSVLARALAREKGIDPALLEQKHTLKNSINLRPVVSGELHAGSVGSISSYNRFVITAGLQDENIKLSKRDADQTINKLKEFGSLHRHDSTITTTVFTPSNHGQLCLSGAENGIIYVWSPLNQWDCIGVLRAHKARILAIAPHPTANMALSLSSDSRLVMWDLRPGSFKDVFNTQLRHVKPSWGNQPLPPMAMLFSPDGAYYSILYNRCVYNYHTMGEHAGKIVSIVNKPDDVTTLWSSMQFLDQNHIILGNEKGDLYVYNFISTKLLTVLTGSHNYRVKAVLPIPTTHSDWIHQFTNPLIKIEKPKPAVVKTVKTATPTKKHKSTPVAPVEEVDNDPVETRFVVSGDSDGKIVLWQIEIQTSGAETIMIEPKGKKSDNKNENDDEFADLFDEKNNLDEIDTATTTPTEENSKPKFSYPVMTSVATAVGKCITQLNINTRITCLCLALPFDNQNLNPLGNQYRSMGHVMETINESTTQYEDATDAIWDKQRADYARSYRKQKDDDFKLKVRDYHRMKAGKIKDLAEGDAVKKGSNPDGEKIKGFGKEKYRKMDEEFQREHQKKQAEKNKGGDKPKRMTRLEAKVAKRANPSLAGTLRARKRNGGKKGPTTRGKRRF